jgi:hypothetical protein
MNKGCAVDVDRSFTAAGVDAAWLAVAGRGFAAATGRASFLAAVLLLSFFCDLGRAAPAQEKPAGGKPLHVRVRAVDTLGKPIAGALIETWQSGGEGSSWWTARRVIVKGGKEIHTGPDGWATISFSVAVKPGNSNTPRSALCLTAQAKHYLVTRSGDIDPAQSGRFEVVLTLRRLVSVAGRVLDQQGRPVTGATVFHTGNATPRTEVKTDAAGHFCIDGLPEGKSPLFVTQPGYHFHGQLIDTSAGAQVLRLLAADKAPAPLHTLPPLRPHEEELKMARQVFWPLWQAAMKSKGDQEKAWCCNRYAQLEPWAAYDYVATKLPKDLKNSFVYRAMPLLYAAQPEESLAALESIEWGEGITGRALLSVVSGTPNLSRKQKLDLLDRAAQHLQAATDPNERLLGLSGVALRLFEVGQAEEAKKLVGVVGPAATQLSPKTGGAACVAAAQAVSLCDLPAGLRLIYAARDAGDENNWARALFHVAYRIARDRPVEAERLAIEAIAYEQRSYPAHFRRENRRTPTENELATTGAWQEKRLVPLCYHLASADAVRAERVARAIQSPFLRAYALGMVAKALASSQRATARRLLLQAYDKIAEGFQKQDRRWISWPLDPQPSTVAAALLPVVEEIDPALVGDCLWHAISFRLHRPADAFLLWLQPEDNDAVLAAFLARYDRGLAHALLPGVDTRVVPARDEPAYDRQTALGVIDMNEALGELRSAATAGDAVAGRCFANARYLNELVPIESRHRWDFLTARYRLWILDNRYAEDSSFIW